MPSPNLILSLLVAANLAGAATTSSSLSTSSFVPKSCPTAQPTGSLRYSTTTTQAKKLGGSIGLYNGTLQRLQYMQLNVSGSPAVDFTFPSRAIIALEDGSAIEYTPGSSAITLISPGCKSGVVVTNTSSKSSAVRSRRRRTSIPPALEARDTEYVDVTVTLTDLCGTPVTNASPQLDCTPVIYAAESDGSPPTFGEPEHSILDNQGGGVYTGQCTIDAELHASNNNYQTCIAEDSKNLDQLCGEDLQTVKNANDFLEDIEKYVSLAKTILKNTAGALKFYEKGCEYMEKPFTKQELNHEDCGTPDMISIGIQDSKTSIELGTISATPATTAVSAVVSTSSKCSSSTTSSSPGPTGSNLIPDPDFSLGKWKLANGASYQTGPAYVGNTFLRLTGNGTAIQHIPAKLQHGSTYNVSYAMRPTHVTNGCSFVLYVEGTGNYESFDAGTYIGGSADFWFYEVQTAASWDAASATFYVLLELGGNIGVKKRSTAVEKPCTIDVVDVALYAV